MSRSHIDNNNYNNNYRPTTCCLFQARKAQCNNDDRRRSTIDDRTQRATHITNDVTSFSQSKLLPALRLPPTSLDYHNNDRPFGVTLGNCRSHSRAPAIGCYPYFIQAPFAVISSLTKHTERRLPYVVVQLMPGEHGLNEDTVIGTTSSSFRRRIHPSSLER